MSKARVEGRRAGARVCVLACLVLAGAGCGKKGPPLPPLRLVPAAVAGVEARRTAPQVELRFTLPSRNENGPGPINLERVEIYAITMPSGAPPPPNRELLARDKVVGAVPVRPVPEEGEPEDPKDTRPGPGERAVFVEQLGAAQLTPIAVKPAEAEDAAAAGRAPAAGATKTAAPAGPPYPVRVYAIRGVSRGGRPGPPARVVVPLVDVPPAPGRVALAYTERAFTATWIAPVVESPAPGTPTGTPAVTFNVYPRADADAPINTAPLPEAAFEFGPVQFGEEQCVAVRAARRLQNVTIESDASEAVCVVPVDTFAPAAPQGLQAVAASGGVSLSWNANTESDLAGYLVLRGESPGDTLQALTPEPITQTNYRDADVQPGVRYVYAIVAVDQSTPPNASAQSERQEVTAR